MAQHHTQLPVVTMGRLLTQALAAIRRKAVIQGQEGIQRLEVTLAEDITQALAATLAQGVIPARAGIQEQGITPAPDITQVRVAIPARHPTRAPDITLAQAATLFLAIGAMATTLAGTKACYREYFWV